jgi:hypothetical protein
MRPGIEYEQVRFVLAQCRIHRMKDFDHVPKTAQAITLTPISKSSPNALDIKCGKSTGLTLPFSDYDNDNSTPGYYAALDTENNPFYLAVCSITDLESKIFLVKDIDSGIQTLTDPNLQSVVTGGVVTGCVPLALKSSGAGF